MSIDPMSTNAESQHSRPGRSMSFHANLSGGADAADGDVEGNVDRGVADVENVAAGDVREGAEASPRRHRPRVFYRSVMAKDAADQAEVFHHAVMQGASRHYSLEQRRAWASALPREASAWSARQALYTTLVADCDGHCVGFVELDLERARIVTLYVWPSLAGRGIGGRLLALAEQRLVEGGARRMIIEASLMLAERLSDKGWESHGEEWVERNGERLPRHCMSKTLRSPPAC
ncbi:GNAT family N-acetyltransferase [Halomonas sp. V046]|uniref:GNAT family N-acetyltransferase n=1 Tax=Halomonas sp. V046 TaxID=3459611 RepID=UPI0040448C1F